MPPAVVLKKQVMNQTLIFNLEDLQDRPTFGIAIAIAIISGLGIFANGLTGIYLQSKLKVLNQLIKNLLMVSVGQAFIANGLALGAIIAIGFQHQQNAWTCSILASTSGVFLPGL